MLQRPTLFPLLVVVAALGACREASEPPFVTPSIDLLAQIEEARVECPALDRLVRRSPPRAWIVDASFDAPLGAEWWSAAPAPTGPDPVEGRSVVLVAPRVGRLTRFVKATGGAEHLVTARVRSAGRDGGDDPATPAGLWVRSLPRPPVRDELEAGAAEEVFGRAGPWRTATLDAAGDGWKDLVVLLPATERRGGLEVALLPGDSGLLVDELRVRRLGALEARALAEPSRAVDSTLLRARVDVPGERRDALLLSGGGRVTFDVRVPDRRARLDVATTLLPGASGSVTWRVLVDDAVVATRVSEPAPFDRSEFEPWVVPLEEFAGRTVRLALAVEGTEDTEAAWGTPRLLGTPSTRPGPNLVLVSLDTLRADHVGAIEPGGLTPHLDAFAAEGTAFSRALTVGAYTLPAHATMMTGQHPLEHGVNKAPERLDPARSPLLAVRLAARGWTTAAFTGGGFVDPRFGFDHGFARYGTQDPGLTDDLRHVSVRTEQVLASPVEESSRHLEPVLEHLDRVSDQPFFLFLHTYVVHNYLPHREFLETPEVRPELADVAGDELYRRAVEEKDPAAAERLAWLYRATVRQADRLFVRPLLERIDALGLAGDTVVAFVADHGEQFLEHGEFGHFGFPWAENVRVPLLLRGPGIPAGARIDAPVTLQELAPTLARLLSLPEDPRTTGWPLLGEDAGAPPERDVVWEHPERWSAHVHGEWKLVRDAPADGAERHHLFRFDLDPEDARDLAAERPHVVRRMLERLAKRADALRSTAPAGSGAPDLDADIEDRLKALGYLGDG